MRRVLSLQALGVAEHELDPLAMSTVTIGCSTFSIIC